MLLTDTEILENIKNKRILIHPYKKACLGSNSYDVHLSRNLAVYVDEVLDAKKHNKIRHFKIPKDGYVLEPGILYLGATKEYTESHDHVPFLEGKSSTGRLGIDIHATAGKGDIGFCGYWTLEISVKQPVKVYAGMPIGQLIYFKVEGKVTNPYHLKQGAKYAGQHGLPVESMMFKNQF